MISCRPIARGSDWASHFMLTGEDMTDGRYILIGVPEYGSAIVEAALELSGQPYEFENIDPDDLGPGSTRLGAINPLGQVPTLILPDGSAMTESAAMILHLNDVAPQAGLVPPPDDPSRPAFLRWLVFLAAGLYPTFTFGDDPKRWVSDRVARRELRDRTDSVRKDLWHHVEQSIKPDPWFLGQRFSALDIYVTVMNHWRPNPDWFAENTPKLDAIAKAGRDLQPLQKVWTRNKIIPR